QREALIKGKSAGFQFLSHVHLQPVRVGIARYDFIDPDGARIVVNGVYGEPSAFYVFTRGRYRPGGLVKFQWRNSYGHFIPGGIERINCQGVGHEQGPVPERKRSTPSVIAY